MAQLQADLDTFSVRLEEEERRYVEEQYRARFEAEEREKAEAEEFRRMQEGTAAPKPKSALIALLQDQVQAKAQPRPGQAALESILALDAKLKQAFDYLAEFVRQFNAATPAFSGKLSLPFVGVLPTVTLGEGFVDFRKKSVHDKSLFDYVMLTYRMATAERARVALNVDEARLLKAQLKRFEMKFEERAVSDSKYKVPHVVLSIDCSMPAGATLHADYDALVVEVRCRNVGAIGQFKFRIGAADFNDDALEEFGKYLLGFPSRIMALRQPD